MNKACARYWIAVLSLAAVLVFSGCSTAGGQSGGFDEQWLQKATPAQFEAAIDAGKDPNLNYSIGSLQRDVPTIFAVVHLRRPDLLPVLLKHHVDIEAKTKDGVTPLASAAYSDNIIMVDALLKAGADPNAMSPKFGSVLHMFRHSFMNIEPGRSEVAKALLDHHAQDRAPSGGGSAP